MDLEICPGRLPTANNPGLLYQAYAYISSYVNAVCNLRWPLLYWLESRNDFSFVIHSQRTALLFVKKCTLYLLCSHYCSSKILSRCIVFSLMTEVECFVSSPSLPFGCAVLHWNRCRFRPVRFHAFSFSLYLCHLN